jgi:hypothetical protein
MSSPPPASRQYLTLLLLTEWLVDGCEHQKSLFLCMAPSGNRSFLALCSSGRPFPVFVYSRNRHP